MTDGALVAKRLALVETCVADLRREARLDRLRSDLRELRFVEHTLQIAIQAALDVASHVASDERLAEPTTNRARSHQAGVLPRRLARPPQCQLRRLTSAAIAAPTPKTSVASSIRSPLASRNADRATAFAGGCVASRSACCCALGVSTTVKSSRNSASTAATT